MTGALGDLGEAGGLLVAALFLALVANRLVETFVTPVFDKTGLDKWWLLPISWVVGGLLGWLSGINLFGPWLPDQLAGHLLTIIVIAGGSNLLHDLFDRSDGPTRMKLIG